MNLSTGIVYCIVGAACALSATAASAELAVIVAADSPVTTLSADQVADIFLGKTGRFPGGGRAVPIDAPENHPLRGEFYATVIGTTPPQLRAYWSKLIFTGRGRPPRVAANGETIKELVAEHPELIGYIDKRRLDSTVKVVVISEERGK